MWPSQDLPFNMYKEQSFPIQVLESASLAGEEVQMPVIGVTSFPFRMSLCLEFQACEMSRDAGGEVLTSCIPRLQDRGDPLYSCCSVTKSRSTAVNCSNPLNCSTPSSPVLHHLPESAQTHAFHWMPSSHLSFATPFSSWPQSFPASGSFPMNWLCTRWPKYWSCSFSFSSSNEYSGLISFRIH